jgi:hypothetical protein
MKKEDSNERVNDDARILTIYEEAKRKNLMDWGIIETAESILPIKTPKD